MMNKYNEKSTFVGDGKEYISSKIDVVFLSWIACQYHFENESQNKFINHRLKKYCNYELYFYYSLCFMLYKNVLVCIWSLKLSQKWFLIYIFDHSENGKFYTKVNFSKMEKIHYA